MGVGVSVLVFSGAGVGESLASEGDGVTVAFPEGEGVTGTVGTGAVVAFGSGVGVAFGSMVGVGVSEGLYSVEPPARIG